MGVLFFLGGVVIGVILSLIVSRRKPIGTLKVENSDPDSSPYLFLEIDCGKSHLIEKNKEITLRVSHTQN